MKIRVINPAFYNDEYLKDGRIIEFKGDKCPSWAEPVKEQKTKNEKNEDKKDQQNLFTQQNQTKNESETKNVPPEAESYLERLLNEALEKNIYLENTDKKTVDEQIKELEKLLGYDKKGNV